MQAIKLLLNDFQKASRDKREIAVLQELGYEVLVVYPYANVNTELVREYNISRLHQFELNYSQPKLLRLLLIFINKVWAVSQICKLQAAVISCHDLGALNIAWMANICKSSKAKLVYDSHEFEIERSTKRGKLAKWYITHLERFLMKRCAFSIMVNDSIADEVQSIHGLTERPVVVRNIAPYWHIDGVTGLAVRQQICTELQINEDTTLVMYHGGIMPHRGIENMLRAVALVLGTAAIVLGYGEQNYLAKLHALTDELGIADRTWFHAAVPIEELPQYVCAADIEMVILEPVVKNHFYTLPNKYFESIQGEVPVIVSDFPEVGRLTEQYEIGYKVDPEDVAAIAKKIILMKTDKEQYARFKANLCSAKEELCWEKEKQIVSEAYLHLKKVSEYCEAKNNAQF